jgi:hypothetical protein
LRIVKERKMKKQEESNATVEEQTTLLNPTPNKAWDEIETEPLLEHSRE